MDAESLLAFVTPNEEPPGLRISVNFGMFAGRAATPAEIDGLAEALLPYVGQVTVVAEERHEIGREAEASVHQVRVEVAQENVPGGTLDEKLEAALLEETQRWAEACIADRQVEVGEL